jgi:hypothetical protein
MCEVCVLQEVSRRQTRVGKAEYTLSHCCVFRTEESDEAVKEWRSLGGS